MSPDGYPDGVTDWTRCLKPHLARSLERDGNWASAAFSDLAAQHGASTLWVSGPSHHQGAPTVTYAEGRSAYTDCDSTKLSLGRNLSATEVAVGSTTATY